MRGTFRSWPVVVGASVLGLWVLVAITVPLWAWAVADRDRRRPAAVTELVAPARHRRARPRRAGPHAVRRPRVDPDGGRGDRADRPHRLARSAPSPASSAASSRASSCASATSCWRSRRSSSPWPSPPPSGPACATRSSPSCSCGGRSTPACCAARCMSIKHREHVEAATSVGVPRAADPAQARPAARHHARDDQRHDGLRAGADPHRVAELPRPRRHARRRRSGA